MPDFSLTVPTASVDRCGLGLAFVRDKRFGITWCHASVFAFTGTRKACSRSVRSYVAKGDGQDRPSRRLEWAFPRPKLVAALNFVYPNWSIRYFFLVEKLSEIDKYTQKYLSFKFLSCFSPRVHKGSLILRFAILRSLFTEVSAAIAFETLANS